MHNMSEIESGTPQKVPWFVRDEADNTIRLVGGLLVFALGMVGVFFLEMSSIEEKPGTESRKYLTPALLHSLFAFIAGWIGGAAAGKKLMNGQNGKAKP